MKYTYVVILFVIQNVFLTNVIYFLFLSSEQGLPRQDWSRIQRCQAGGRCHCQQE